MIESKVTCICLKTYLIFILILKLTLVFLASDVLHILIWEVYVFW